MRWCIAIVLLFSGVLVTGCAKGGQARDPFQPPPPDFLVPSKGPDGSEMLSEKAQEYLKAFAKAQSESNEKNARAIRNDFAAEALAAIDQNYTRFYHDHFTRRAISDLTFDMLNLIAGGVGTITGGETTKTVTNALVTLFTGTKLSIKTNLYSERASLAILDKMDALRAEQRAPIEEHLKQSAADYPIRTAIFEISAYYRAGTVMEALAGLNRDASEDKEAKETELKSLLGTFQKDAPGDLLRSYWKPDGVQIDRSHETAIQNAMRAAGVDPTRTSITSFIRSKEFESQRNAVVQSLKLSQATTVPTEDQ